MRVLISGGVTRESALIAAALSETGFVVVEPGFPFDLRLTVDRGHGERIVRDDLALDPVRREVAWGDRRARLTGMECALLATLMRAGSPLARESLLDTVWGYGSDPGTNVVAVHISRLRAKIGTDRIIHTREGYRLAA